MVVMVPIEYQVLEDNFSRQFQNQITQRAQRDGVTIVDPLASFRNACDEKANGRCTLQDHYLFADVWMHPSALGHTLLANSIFTSLSEQP